MSFDDLLQAAPRQLSELELRYHAATRLREREAAPCIEIIRSAVAIAASMISSGDKGQQAINKEEIVKFLTDKVAKVDEYLILREQREARRRYVSSLFVGVLLSALLLVTVGLVGAWLIRHIANKASDPDSVIDHGVFLTLRDSIVCLAGGASGAVISLLIRLRKVERIDAVNATWSGAWQRVILGWFFAATLLFLVKGGIVTVFTDPTAGVIAPPKGQSQAANTATTIKSFFFWGALGILAGFNERWVRTMIIREGSEEDGATDSSKLRQSGAQPHQPNAQ